MLIITAISCNVEYHPYDTKIKGERHVNNTNIQRIESDSKEKQEISFAVISDTQRRYDDTEAVVNAINQRDDIDFVIHTGDITDFGMKKEFEQQRDILNELKVPYVCIIGNHDCLGTGVFVFKEVFGDLDFAFTAGGVRFICLNTNALEFDHTMTVPNFGFIETELNNMNKKIHQTVVAMHAAPDSEQADIGVANIFQQQIKKFTNLQFCVHGHGHNFDIKDIFEDGILYYECDSVSKRFYLIFTLNAEGYEYERVAF